MSIYKHIAEKILKQALGENAIDADRSDFGVDFLVTYKNLKYATFVDGVISSRINDVIGRIAISVLKFRSLNIQNNYEPFIIVVVPSFGNKMIGCVREFVRLHTVDMSWCLIGSKSNSIHMEVAACEDPIIWSSNEEVEKESTRRVNLFTDLNMLMLKILLLKNVPDKYWSWFNGKIDNPTQLARVSGVSNQTAHAFVKELKEYDFARVTKREGVHLIRVRRLIDLLFADEQMQRIDGRFARHISGTVDIDEMCSIFKYDSDIRFAVGGFDACRRYGVLHAVPVGVPMVHVSDMSKVFSNNSLIEACDERDASVFFSVPRRQKCLFRTSNDCIVDILQAAIDVVNYPINGLEQAEFIRDFIIELVE